MSILLFDSRLSSYEIDVDDTLVNNDNDQDQVLVQDSYISPTVSPQNRYDNSFSSFDDASGSFRDSWENVFEDEHLDVNKMTLLRELFKNVLSKLDNMEILINSLKGEKNELLTKLNNLSQKFETKSSSFKDELYNMQCRITRNEQYSRRESIIISGIPENIHHQYLEENVVYILKEMGMTNIQHYDIAACHRLLKNRNSPYPAKTIVKFINRKDAEFCLRNRDRIIEIRNKINMNLRIYESLCSANEKVLADCHRLKHLGFIEEFYIRNGFVKIVINEGDSPKRIEHIDILKNTFKAFYENQASANNT